MRILAIDPGSTQSAYVVVDTQPSFHLVAMAIVENPTLVESIAVTAADVLAIERIESYGMPVGVTVFDTVFWSGRFVERWSRSRGVLHAPAPWHYVTRRAVKLHLCHSMRARDSSVRTALLDKYGPGKSLAVGTKANPGPLYGLRSDLWSAFAVAVTHYEGHELNALKSQLDASLGISQQDRTQYHMSGDQ